MEDIWIPKLSVLMTYDKILTDMKQFCAVTGYEPQFALTPNGQVAKNHKQSVFTLSSMYRSIRNHVLNTTRQGYNIISEEEHSDTFLSRDIQIELRQKKNLLLKIIHKHDAVMEKLRIVSMKCSKTQAKTEENAMSVAKKENVFDKWIIHKIQVQYEKRLQKEIRLREKLENIARDMQADICAEINDVIVQLMEENDQIIESEELSKLTNTLYKQACRVYTFQIIEMAAKAKMTEVTGGQHDAEIMGDLSHFMS